MTPTSPDPDLAAFYAADAQAYLKSLPLSHFMESTEQATQRAITVESFELIRVARPDVQCFSELLIQYPQPGFRKPGKVVPDNFVVVHREPIVASGSYALANQPVGPLLVLEYVAKHNPRKDYDDNFDKYQAALKVPYYLIFYPDNAELTLFRLTEGTYASVAPNPAGRYAVPELELEVGLLGEWVRYWFRGALLPLPGDLLIERDAAREQRDEARTERDEARHRLEAERQAREAERRAREEAERRAEAERQSRLAVEAEVARLREELAKPRGGAAG
ncbi:Genome sequencing data, contig C328 OS=Microcystis aeruginosa PCC 9432 GN=MICCA_1540004 PE=4 SV=1: Uma2 [Gemmataceae bacterium]|nr:Genome sequencing data, contig C328 OS=Microcystis aeruginosa PCC 9432 GN=MICCA_1540004 PE=4 SV=1: Uma2 [Gemmataceae bacterium]VTT96737.1 Genome sequencing data, contig C328 OS=Microcystis aeruginosa PCC 9432 GN=MICCA_1540004 PE=4 SV=1: Uma2 [Gemmataceae bacterium]